jgi:arginyl-tRNA synthetase
MEERIRQAIQGALAKAGLRHAEAGSGHAKAGAAFVVERPDMAHGDYATNAALVAAKQLGKNPHSLAESLAPLIEEALGSDAGRVEVAGPGFINITLAPDVIRAITAEAAESAEWGKGSAEAGKRVGIEYSNPNPFKEIHIGHLMSNVVGESLSRLIANSGATVIRDTFGGDVGPHVAKALWALRKKGTIEIESAKQIGEAYAQGSNAYDTDEIAKAEIDALNVEIYDAVEHQADAVVSAERQALLTLWRSGREVSMAEFRRLFKILGTKLDYEFFDSDTTEPGMRIVRDGLEKGIFEKSDGAVIYRGEKVGLHTLVFITSRGTPTYEAKDVGLAFLREERIATDEVIIVTAVEQIGHFKVFLAALSEIAPLIAAKTKHAPHGLLRLPSGKMSSRKGNVITGADLVEEMIAKASEKNSDPLIAEQVAIGAIKYMILRQGPGTDIIFDPEKSLSLEGDSGPYLQYALVRAVKILSYNSEDAGGAEVPEAPYALERVIIHYPEIAARAARELAPNLLVNYLSELAGAWNAFYATEQVLGSQEEQYKQRVARAFAQTMANGLGLLGIPAPERM